MLLGLRSALYPAPDLARAKAWYTQLLGQAPSFDQPFYVGFEVGGFELGLLPQATPATAGPQPLWAVTDPFGNRLGIIENPYFDRAKVR
jgi:catechol 2,3-dioxygenase-like lactoylglutathione lyase family enzyme